ncbi:MAG TPA: hypothetical protein VMB03_28055 [Bryobacteraceae bacterium]|nr:hypothetical protein [Bryobacteraceae bacterium]
MYRRIAVCVLAFAFLATGQQTITVQKLIEFVKSQVQMIKEKRGTDKELALSLGSIRLSEKLDMSVIEDLQGDGAGPQTVKALERLAEQSKSLKAAVIEKPEVYVPPPPPSSIEQGKILDEAREYVANYDNSIPDFICLEIEQRYIAPNHGGRSGNDPSFRLLDTITSKITYFEHKEKKETILNGSRPVNTSYESLGGATSRGDFETALRMLFDPATQTRFEWARWATWRTRLTMVFSYRVSRDRSQYRIGTGDHKVERITAYSGEVFIDAERPYKVTRLTSKAEDIPVDFPIQRAETTLDYKYVDIGGQSFLLPYDGVVMMDGPDGMSKNDNRFDFYRKYEVGSTITFDLPKDFTPPAETKEQPPVNCKDPKNKDAAPCKQQ